MRPFKITFLLSAGFGLLLAILFGFGSEGISRLCRLDAPLPNIVFERCTEQQLAHQAAQLSDQGSQITLQLYLTEDTNAIQALLAQRAANLQHMAELINVIEPRLEARKEKRLFAAVKATQTLYNESSQQALALRLEQRREAAAKMMANEVRPKLLTCQNAWSAFDQYETDEINQVWRRSKPDFAADQRNLLTLLAIAGLMVAGIASVTIRRLRLERSVSDTMGISHAITKRKQAEEILHESEARFAAAFEHAPIGMALVSPDGWWLKVNHALCELTGYSEAELLKRTYQDITHKDDLESCGEYVRQLFAGEVRSCRSEKNYVHRSGHCVPVSFHLSLVRDGRGQPLYLITQIKDITERRAAEAVLKELSERTERRERMLTTTLSNMNDFAYIFDREGRFLFANEPLLRLWGITLEAAVGKNFSELAYPDDLARKLQSQVQQVFDTRQSVTDETLYTSPTGVRGCYEYIFSPVIAADGSVEFVVGCTRDVTARKQAEEALRESEERFSDAFEFAPIGKALVSPDARLLKVNRALCELLDYSETELLNGNFYDLMLADDLEESLENMRQMAAGKLRRSHMERHCRRKSGEIITVLLNVSLLRDAHGEPLYFIAQIQDITERQRAGNELRESKRFLRSALDALSAHIAILDEKGTIIEVNAAWNSYAHKNGFKSDRSAGINYLKVCEEAAARCSTEASLVAEGIRAVMAGRSEEFILEYPCPGSSEQSWFMLRVTRFADDGPVRVVVAHENITERKRAEESLVLFRALIDHSNDAIEVIDPETMRFLDINEGACARLGYTRKELLTMSVLNVDEEITRPLQEEIAKQLQSRGFITFESRHRRKDGTKFEVEVNLKRVQLDKAYLVSTVRDISERKKLESQAIRSQKLETVGKLAGGIAHEFNSILTAIMGQSELLLDVLPEGSPLMQNATEIGQAAARAAALTRQLLAYGRKQMLQPVVLDLNLVIVNMGQIVQRLLGADKDVRVISALDLQMVKADTAQIEQVIINLVLNARDAMPNGGKLTLETANITLDHEYVSHFPASEVKAGGYVMLAISDTGTGMSEAVKARLFEPFFSTKGVGQGTGLGLSTCYGIVKQSGGHISVYSELGRGTTFKIYLPQVAPEANLSVPRLAALNLPHGTETILVVEDDPALRAMAATLLQRLGYTVLTAANGVEALGVQKERSTGRIDLLFTDVVMPQMSGRELADRVRALYPHTKILFTSAYTGNAIIHQGALDEGMALLQKPFTPAALAKKLREVLNEAGVPEGAT